MLQIFELREVLEGLTSRRAATLISDDQLERLHKFFQDIVISEAGT